MLLRSSSNIAPKAGFIENGEDAFMTQSRRIIPACTLALLGALAGPALGQSSEAARIKELEKKLERSMELIEQLSSKINKIEQANSAAAAAQGKSAQQASKIEELERHVSEIGSSLSRRSSDDGLPVHGFADVGLVRDGENNVTSRGRKGAALGTFDLYLAPQFGDRVKALIELAFEADRDGGIATDLERLQVGYTFSDAATGWLGRFHTPFGYWNTAFHHGMQIQTSTTRPRFLDFEDKGGILLAHSTGVWFTGAIGAGGGKFGYDLYAANAPRIAGSTLGTALSTAHPGGFSAAVNAGTYAGTGTLNMRQSGSTSSPTSFGFNTWFEPRAVSDLRVGLHGLRAEVRDDLANMTQLRMFGGYFAYTGDPWEVMGEYYRFRNNDLTGATGVHASWAGFTQVGYTMGKWTPFGRIERTKLDQTDNYFGVQESGRSYRRTAAGVRFDVDPKAALKVEFMNTRKEDLGPGVSDRYNELRLQYSIRF